MQSDNKFFDDMTKLAEGAMGTFAAMKKDMDTAMRDQFELFVGKMDMVSREEFEAVKQVAVTAREQQEKLEKRVAALEKQLKTKASPAKAPAKKTAKTTKKTAKK